MTLAFFLVQMFAVLAAAFFLLRLLSAHHGLHTFGAFVFVATIATGGTPAVFSTCFAALDNPIFSLSFGLCNLVFWAAVAVAVKCVHVALASPRRFDSQAAKEQGLTPWNLPEPFCQPYQSNKVILDSPSLPTVETKRAGSTSVKENYRL
jgi:hypothetical protein